MYNNNETLFYKKNEFEDFIKNLNSKNTDYINYVSNSDLILNKTLFISVENIVDNESFEKLDLLRIEGSLKIKNSDKKSKNQYVSGFNKYLDFIENYIVTLNPLQNNMIENDDDLEGSITPNYSDLSDQLYLFDKEALINKFQFRLITQNRFNKNGIYFPISFLKQYFYKIEENKYFDTVILNQIDKIKYYSNDELKSFRDIDVLEIKASGNVLINGNIIQSKCSKDEILKPMEACQLSDITLDHTYSMDKILKEFGDKHKDSQLYKISKAIKKGLHKPLTYNKLRKRGTVLSNNIDFVNDIIKDKLKLEFEEIINQMELIMMQADHNNFKRAK